jgi:host factor-I protein
MANAPQGNLQDTFLNNVRKENINVIVYLINGSQLRGKVKQFDNFTILLEADGKIQLVYKHAVSTIIPAKFVSEPRSSRAASRSQKTEE